MIHRRLRSVFSALVVVLASVSTGWSAPADTAKQEALILDTTGFWRLYHELRPPVIETDEGFETIHVGRSWLDAPLAGAPANWREAGFDDSGWLRGPARIAADSHYLYRLCLRGKFTVADLDRAGNLRLTVGYRGGIIVTVNGTEIARGHLPRGDLAKDVMSEGYPEEAYVTPDGKLLSWGAYWRKPPEETARRLALRTRTLTDVAVPKKLLRKGVNVVALEIIRAPYHKVMAKHKLEATRRNVATGTLWNLQWPTCAIRHVQLKAPGADGFVPSAARPKGFQVWNNDLVMGDFDLDFGNPSQPLKPVRIVGTRGGSFSGKVVVGSSVPIEELHATLPHLAGPTGVIPPSCIRIRYALPWGTQYKTNKRYIPAATLMGALSETPPKTVPVRVKTLKIRDPLRLPAAAKTVWGAVCPIWVTVDVPPTAKAGTYRGTLTICAKGEKPVGVPVSLEVADWTLPDPQDYKTWVELWQSPDTLAMEYDLPLWSPKHLELVGRALDHFRGVGSRVVYIPLLAHTNMGNAQSYVRWVKIGGDKHLFDFTPMERYLDVVERHMGRPKMVVVWVWDVALSDIARSSIQPRELQKALKELQGKGPLVTFFNPVTGKTRNHYLPPYTDAKSRDLWQPLFEQLKHRLARRGLEGVVMFGVGSDAVPKKEEVEFFASLWPKVPWVVHSHGGSWSRSLFKNAKVGYYDKVFARFPKDVGKGQKHGWRRPELVTQLNRHWTGTIDYFPASVWRHITEINITGEQRGVGRLGGDFWPVIKNKQGMRKGRIYERYNECRWRANDICTSLLGPGPTGPVATSRLEVMREGLQECEARIFIEQALLDEKLRAMLGDDLARRCQDVLDERLRVMLRALSTLRAGGGKRHSVTAPSAWWNTPGLAGHAWFVGSGWQDRAKKLYSLAGEVAVRIGRK